ncbi:hypothetical protein AAEO56_11630 [Flavobacterium sp. DGU11]|uniref:Uncharacterized protein n=1 Tax=Flavobacterium arundinis TaxID=3139143 RepID=A0ABU9HY55_9FLAO
MLSFAAYKRSFGSLIGLVNENKELTEKQSKTKEGKNNLKVLNKEIAAIDNVIGKEGQNKEAVQQDLVAFISAYKGVSVYMLESIHGYSNDNYKIYTNVIDVTGGINELMKLSYDAEKKVDFSRLINLDFYIAKKDNNTNTLHLKMIFQNYEKNK